MTTIRDKYIEGSLYKIGDIIVDPLNTSIHEVIGLGTNYLTVVDEEGDVSKKWLDKVIEANSLKEAFNEARRKRSSKNQLAISGYKTSYFTEEIYDVFHPLLKEKDKLGILYLVQSTDELIHESQNITEDNYSQVKSLWERTLKQLLHMDSLVEHSFYRIPIGEAIINYEMEKGINFSLQPSDIAVKLLAEATEVPLTNGSFKVDIVNEAARVIKSKKFSENGWKFLGKLFNLVTDSGVNWDKNILSPSTKKYMEIK